MTKLKALLLRLRYPRGKRAYLHSLAVVHKGVLIHTAAVRCHYRLDVPAIMQVEEDFRTKTGSVPTTLSITPLDEYSRHD